MLHARPITLARHTAFIIGTTPKFTLYILIGARPNSASTDTPTIGPVLTTSQTSNRARRAGNGTRACGVKTGKTISAGTGPGSTTEGSCITGNTGGAHCSSKCNTVFASIAILAG